MEYIPFSAKFRLSRIPYYLKSVFTLIGAIEPSYRLEFIFSMLFSAKIKTVHLKNNLTYRLKTLLDILTLIEVVVENQYQSHGVRVDSRDSIIVDIGAGYGDFAILVAKKFPEAKIYAFEPDPYYFSLLKDNLTVNGVLNVIPVNTAVAGLEQIVKTLRSHQIDFMKMDCEGCEYSILRDNNRYLKTVDKLVMEYHEYGEKTVSVLRQLLTGAKFKVNIYPQKDINNFGILVAYKI